LLSVLCYHKEKAKIEVYENEVLRKISGSTDPFFTIALDWGRRERKIKTIRKSATKAPVSAAKQQSVAEQPQI
jgi:hypothetical protein